MEDVDRNSNTGFYTPFRTGRLPFAAESAYGIRGQRKTVTS